jgi:hypothetical protein
MSTQAYVAVRLLTRRPGDGRHAGHGLPLATQDIRARRPTIGRVVRDMLAAIRKPASPVSRVATRPAKSRRDLR